MPTLEFPSIAFTGTLAFVPASHRRLRASTRTAAPAYRIYKGIFLVPELRTYRRDGLCASLHLGPHRAPAHSSWTRS
jgi:hypothetical protein